MLESRSLEEEKENYKKKIKQLNTEYLEILETFSEEKKKIKQLNK